MTMVTLSYIYQTTITSNGQLNFDGTNLNVNIYDGNGLNWSIILNTSITINSTFVINDSLGNSLYLQYNGNTITQTGNVLIVPCIALQAIGSISSPIAISFSCKLSVGSLYEVNGNLSASLIETFTTGTNNVVYKLGPSGITTGNDNVAIGWTALNSASSNNDCVAIGFQSQSASTADYYNTSVGSNTLQNNNGGSQNVAIGNNALQSATNTSDCIAIGYNALSDNNNVTSGTIAIGIGAGYGLNSNNCIAIGTSSLTSLNDTSVGDNIAIGTGAMISCGNGTNQNIAIGSNTMPNATGDAQCVAIGYHCLYTDAGGNIANTAIGYDIQTSGTVNNNVLLGANILCSNNNCIVLGQGCTTSIDNSLNLNGITINSSATTGTSGALPVQTAGYLNIYINGTQYNIPLYNP